MIERPRNTHALPLPATQAYPALPYDRVVAIGEPLEIVDLIRRRV